MPRLVTFGCSFTYGHSLSDCYIGNGRPGDSPSKFAWPNLLAEKLNYECLNLSACGSGNYQILLDILRTDFEQDDLVVIGYSYFDRYENYLMTDKIDAGFQITSKSKKLKHRIEINKVMLGETSEEQKFWNNWLSIQHAEMILNSKNIKNYSFLNVPEIALETKPDLIDMENFIDHINLNFKDYALDNEHPGIKTHQLQSEQLYSIIAL
jgi:hypothetical protein